MGYKGSPAHIAYAKQYYLEHKEKYAARAKAAIPKRIATAKKQRKALKAALLLKYGPRCKWCGFADPRALQVDHVQGNGARDRRENEGSPTHAFYKRVLADTTGTYQILCANCNTIKGTKKEQQVIRINEVAQLKASHEDVFVLKIHPDSTTVTVRRPTGTQNGVIHLTEEFTLPELETQDEARTRELAERFSLQQKFATLSGNPPNDAPASMQ